MGYKVYERVHVAYAATSWHGPQTYFAVSPSFCKADAEPNNSSKYRFEKSLLGFMLQRFFRITPTVIFTASCTTFRHHVISFGADRKELSITMIRTQTANQVIGKRPKVSKSIHF
jgi:hypothetical protein